MHILPRVTVVAGALLWLLPSLSAAQSITSFSFDPLVIPSARTEPVLLEATISPRPTRVTLEFNPGSAGAARELELRDDGTGGDRRAGDNVYSVALSAPDIIGVLRADDVQRVFIGFLNVFNGAERTLRANMFVDVHTDDVGTTPITRISSDVQATSRLVNINDPAFFVDFSVARITRRFYAVYGDDYDFLNIVSTPSRLLNRDHSVVKNDIDGIGMGRTGLSASFGSAGRLRGISRFPSVIFFDGASTGYNHELGHQWISALNFQPFDSGVPHWPLSSMAGGVMGWSTRGGQGLSFVCDVVLDGGTVRLMPRSGEPVFYDFDLYLMGIIGPGQVSEQVVFADQAAAQRLTCTGQMFTGAISRVTVRTIIDRLGERRPDAIASQKHFRIVTILVSRDGLVSEEAMWLYHWLAGRAELRETVPVHEGFLKSTGRPFFVATRGWATLGTSLGPTEESAP